MNFDEILTLYDEDTPKLILFDANQSEEKEKQIVEQLSKLNGCIKANPLDIIIESWINVMSEKISTAKITFSSKKVLLNREVRDEAVEKITNIIGNDGSKLKEFHDLWLKKFANTLRTLFNHDEKITLDDTVVQLGKQFRISTNSALRAVLSITTSCSQCFQIKKG